MNLFLAYDFDLSTVSASAVAIVPIIVAIVQGIKMIGWGAAERFAPLISMGIGILITMIADHGTTDWTNSILSGVIYGLSASGLYSGVKATAHANKSHEASRNNHHKK